MIENYAYHTVIPILVVIAFVAAAFILLATAGGLFLALYDDIRGDK